MFCCWTVRLHYYIALFIYNFCFFSELTITPFFSHIRLHSHPTLSLFTLPPSSPFLMVLRADVQLLHHHTCCLLTGHSMCWLVYVSSLERIKPTRQSHFHTFPKDTCPGTLHPSHLILVSLTLDLLCGIHSGNSCHLPSVLDTPASRVFPF